jgi:hypothetical protein
LLQRRDYLKAALRPAATAGTLSTPEWLYHRLTELLLLLLLLLLLSCSVATT